MLRLSTLGGLSLTGDAGPLTGAAQQRRRLALLSALAIAGDRGMSRDRLLALLWPEQDTASGRQALSQALYALRRATGAESLVHGVGAEELRLNPEAISSDVADFEAAVARGALEEAAAHYTGLFLDGVHLSGEEGAFERWVDDNRMRLGMLAERVFETLATTAESRGDHDAAARWWRRLTECDPLRTRGATGLMQALVASGDRAGALRHAELYERRVRDDLDAPPSPRVTTLADRLRAETAAGDAPGLVAGRYAIERELGHGSAAVVLLARDVKHDRPVALKVLRPELTAAIDRERMTFEIRVMAQLQHPHILPLHDSGEYAGQAFYVMPYVAGDTLRARLRHDGMLSVSLAVRVARQVADALEHAHRRGLVHRDVKPENILLTGDVGGDPHAIVADFGIVHLVEGSSQRLTPHHFALGTPAYMSPEQIAGEADIDGRSDIFALGCVLYEMLAGRPPWIGITPQTVLTRRLTEMPPTLRSLRADVPAALEEAVQRALVPDRTGRFASAAEFARALESDAGAMPHRARGVPAPPTDLVGRDRERAAATALLVRPDVRLITLTGAGGSGKTSLALQVAADAAAVFEASAFADLAPVTDPALVPAAIAAALGVRDRQDTSVLDAVAATIGTRRMLLLIDNMEQVIGAASDVARLLAASPKLSVLATSRVRLRIRGEHEFFVGPLDLPDLTRATTTEALAAVPAVELFVRRAREARPDVAVDDTTLRAVAEICVRLDGLPLAIELAAARTRLLSPRAILTRLEERRLDFLAEGARDLPARQRTLRGTIAWSYDLLGAGEQAVLRTLGVFAGPFSIDAACAVLGAEVDEALALVQVLSDASLVRHVGEDDEGPRVTLLETIREFALERLREVGAEAAARDRHLAHYLALVERVAPALTGPSQAEAIARLERERGNLIGALEWAANRAGNGDAEPLARLARALWRAWLHAGHWAEGREWLRRALAHAEPLGASRAELLAAVASLAQNQGDYEDAFAHAEQAIACWRALGDRAGEARALTSLGWLAWRRSRFAEGRRLSEQSLELRRELGDERGAAQTLSNIGWIVLFEGRYDEGARLLTESLTIRRRLGDRRDIAFTLTALAWGSALGGDLDRAESYVTEALDLLRTIGDRQLYAFATRGAAEIALFRGQPAVARAMMEQVGVPTFRDMGDRWGLYVALGVIGDALLSERRLAEARVAYDESDAIARALGDRFGVATSRARFALLAAAEGDTSAAESHARASEQGMAEVGGALSPWIASRLPISGPSFRG